MVVEEASAGRTLVATAVSILLGLGLIAASPMVGAGLFQVLFGLGVAIQLGQFLAPQVAAFLAGLVCAPVVLITIKLMFRRFDFRVLTALHFLAATLLLFMALFLTLFGIGSLDLTGDYWPLIIGLYAFFGPAALVGYGLVFFIFGRPSQ